MLSSKDQLSETGASRITFPTLIQSLPSELDRTADRISKLELRREELLHEIFEIELKLSGERAAYNTLINHRASVSKLPVELLSHIFLICQAASAPNFCPSFGVVASHVSHHWRTISLSTPLLWNDIRISKRTRHPLLRLEAYLRRSYNCFLDILVDTSLSDIQPLMTLISGHSERWRRFSLETEYDHLATIEECLRCSSVPKLEYLSLLIGMSQEHNSPRSKYPRECPTIFSEGAPCLQLIRLGGTALGNLAPPTGAISTLDLDGLERYYMEPSQFVSFLETLPSLINLSLGQLHIHHPRDPSQVTKQIELPLLRSLRICGPCTSPHIPLSLVLLPKLRSLVLYELENFHSPVFPSVKELTVAACSFDEVAITNMLLAFPSITELTMDPFIPAICRIITISVDMADSRVPWPCLRTLTLGQLGTSEVLCLSAMVSTRSLFHHAIQRLRIDRRTRIMLRKKDCFNWFKEQMSVVAYEQPETWPAGLGYGDPLI